MTAIAAEAGELGGLLAAGQAFRLAGGIHPVLQAPALGSHRFRRLRRFPAPRRKPVTIMALRLPRPTTSLLLALPVLAAAALLAAAPLRAQAPPPKAEPEARKAEASEQKAEAQADQRAAQDAERRKPKRDGERKPLPQREREEEDDRR